MSYEVVYAAKARQDLRDIFEYISYELLAPDAARGQTKRLMEAASSLEEMPMRYRLYDEEPWRSWGVRVLPVNNYLIFYLPDESKNIVNIIRIMYGGRDVRKQLNDTVE